VCPDTLIVDLENRLNQPLWKKADRFRLTYAISVKHGWKSPRGFPLDEVAREYLKTEVLSIDERRFLEWVEKGI
jgi:hypothetical protein